MYRISDARSSCSMSVVTTVRCFASWPTCEVEAAELGAGEAPAVDAAPVTAVAQQTAARAAITWRRRGGVLGVVRRGSVIASVLLNAYSPLNREGDRRLYPGCRGVNRASMNRLTTDWTPR